MLGLSEGLTAAGHEVSVLAGWPHRHEPDAVRERLDPVELRLHRLRLSGPYTRNVELLARAYLDARGVRNGHAFDLIHGHSGYAHLSALTRVLKRELGVPALHTLYVPITDRLNDSRSRLLAWKAPLRRMLGGIDRVIAISENIRDSVERIGLSPTDVTVVPPAVRQCRSVTREEREERRLELGLGDDEPMVLFVGNLTAAKGFDLVIRAFSEALHSVPKAKLVHTTETGPSHHDSRLGQIERQLERQIPPERRTGLGIVDDMPGLLAASDLFVLPFRETAGPMDYPMALLEAMAAGTAVLTTVIGGIPEIVRDGQNGVMVPPDDAAALGRAMVDLLSNDDRRRDIGDSAREEIRRRFGPDRVSREMEEVYENTLADQ